jgi:hypothetical protein
MRLATVIDTSTLGKLIGVALLAGVGVCAMFGVAILGATRAGELRRDGRPGVAVAYGALALAAGLACLAGVAYGVAITTRK